MRDRFAASLSNASVTSYAVITARLHPGTRKPTREGFTMQIYGPSSLHGAQPIRQPHIRPTGETASRPLAESDEVKFSAAAEARALGGSVGESSSDFRADKVAAMRAEIAKGTYDTDEKLDAAMDRMLERLFG